MASNLRIAYPDIQFRAVEVTDSTPMDDFHETKNSFSGPLYQLCRRSGLISSDQDVIYDMGTDGSDITAAVDYLIITRADISKAETGAQVELASSTDNVSYTTHSTIDLDSETLYGPNSNILIADLESLSLAARRYWRVRFTFTNPSRSYFGKVYLGTAFQFGTDQDPTRAILNRQRSPSIDFITSSGALWSTKVDEMPYQFEVRWEGYLMQRL